MFNMDDMITNSGLKIVRELTREIPREIKNKTLRDSFKKDLFDGVGNWREYLDFKDGEFVDEIAPEPYKNSPMYKDYLYRVFKGDKIPDLELTVFTFDVGSFQFSFLRVNPSLKGYKTDFVIHFPHEYKEVMQFISPEYLTRFVKKHAPYLANEK